MTPSIPASARRSLKRSKFAGSWFVGRQARGLWVKIWTQSPPIASIRSIAVWMPPEVDTWAPSCTPVTLAPEGTAVRYWRGRPSPLCAESDRLTAHRQRPHGALQLALRPSRRRRVLAAYREHRHEQGSRGGDRPDPGVAALARPRLGRRGDLPARPDAPGAGGGEPARCGGEGLRGRGRDPLPHARRGRDRLGRPDSRSDRVPE